LIISVRRDRPHLSASVRTSLGANGKSAEKSHFFLWWKFIGFCRLEFEIMEIQRVSEILQEPGEAAISGETEKNFQISKGCSFFVNIVNL